MLSSRMDSINDGRRALGSSHLSLSRKPLSVGTVERGLEGDPEGTGGGDDEVTGVHRLEGACSMDPTKLIICSILTF